MNATGSLNVILERRGRQHLFFFRLDPWCPNTLLQKGESQNCFKMVCQKWFKTVFYLGGLDDKRTICRTTFSNWIQLIQAQQQTMPTKRVVFQSCSWSLLGEPEQHSLRYSLSQEKISAKNGISIGASWKCLKTTRIPEANAHCLKNKCWLMMLKFSK